MTDVTAPRMFPETDGAGPLLQERACSIPAITVFFAFAFAWSWGAGGVAQIVSVRSPTLAIALAMLSGCGPSLAGIAVVSGRVSGLVGIFWKRSPAASA
jgi:hypothetical protein